MIYIETREVDFWLWQVFHMPITLYLVWEEWTDHKEYKIRSFRNSNIALYATFTLCVNNPL